MRKPTLEETIDLLDQVRDFLDDYIDVLDGDYGQPRPNRAMLLRNEIDYLIGER